MLLTGRSVALMRFATWPSVVRSRRALTMRAAASLLFTSNVTCQRIGRLDAQGLTEMQRRSRDRQSPDRKSCTAAEWHLLCRTDHTASQDA